MDKQKKLEHLMVDIETMGTGSYSAIVSIAAVEFDINTGITGNTFYVNIDLQSCLDAGLKTDEETVQWWSKQSEKAKMMLNEEKATLPEALKMFKKFCKHEDVQIWGNSARFDLGLLENAFEVTKIAKPWQYYNERCVRTLVGFYPNIKKNTPFVGTPHNAIDDCLHQIKYCSAIWNALYPNQPINLNIGFKTDKYE